MSKQVVGVSVALALLALSGAALSGESKPLKIGFVTLSQVADKSVLKQKLDEDIKGFARGKEREGLEMRGKINELKQASLLLDGQALADKKEEIRQMENDLRQFAETIQREMNERSRQASRLFLKALKAVIEEVGKAQGYDYVFSDEIMLYRGSGDDITSSVIERLNAEYATLPEGWAKEPPPEKESGGKE